MKILEFRRLIREEVRKALSEVGNPGLGYDAIEYYMDSDDADASAKYAKKNKISNADIVASFQSGDWKSNSFDPVEIVEFAKSLKMTPAEINTIATALKYSPKKIEQLKSLLGDLKGKMDSILEPLIGNMYEQYDEFKITQSLVNIEISPLENKAAKIFSILEKNKNKLSDFLRTDGLPNCKLVYATDGFDTEKSPKIIITSKPKIASYLKPKKEVQL